MKAKEYFNQYLTENQHLSPDGRVIFALNNMVVEVNAIAKMRNATSNGALIAIFEEQNNKANSLIRMLNNVEPFKSEGELKNDALKIFVRTQTPDLADVLKW